MKIFLRNFSFFITILLIAASPVFSQVNELDDLKDTLNKFSGAMAKSLPFNSTLGLNWSDSYIGQLLDVPPHFGIGFSVGATTLNIDAINSLMGQFGDYSLPIDIPAGLPLPAYTIDARIGGFVLPFDIGLKFGYLDSDFQDMLGVHVNYMLIGADVRYAILNKKTLPVKLSVGLGYNYLSGGISTKISSDSLGLEFEFYDPQNETDTYSISLSDPDLALQWHTHCLELKAHVSFSMPVITPYAGLGLSYAWTNAGFGAKTEMEYKKDGTLVEDIDEINKIKGIVNQLGFDASDTGFGSFVDDEAFNMRLYAGLSFNMAVIRLDLTFMFNIMDSAIGATVGLRFQL